MAVTTGNGGGVMAWVGAELAPVVVGRSTRRIMPVGFLGLAESEGGVAEGVTPA